jgi:hypothetical protein
MVSVCETKAKQAYSVNRTGFFAREAANRGGLFNVV